MLIQSKQNKKIIELSKLDKKKYRDQTNSYIVIGINSIKEASKTNSVILEITTDTDYQTFNEVIYVTNDVMNKIVDVKPTPKNIAQVTIPSDAQFCSSKVLVIDEIQDPGNLGTILRTSLALGICDVFIGNGTVDIYNSKVTRAMQGVEFHINFLYGDVYDYLSKSKLPIVTTFLDEENQVECSLEEFNLVIGNEGRGIDKRIKELEHKNKKIDIEFESLNVAIATAIILNEIR